eukprot:1141529-Pelagomonas_calceolata.AAC.6
MQVKGVRNLELDPLYSPTLSNASKQSNSTTNCSSSRAYTVIILQWGGICLAFAAPPGPHPCQWIGV